MFYVFLEEFNIVFYCVNREKRSGMHSKNIVQLKWLKFHEYPSALYSLQTIKQNDKK